MDEDHKPSKFEKFRKNPLVTHIAAAAAGAATFAVALRLHNGIHFNERIWGIQADVLRKQLESGSSNLITNNEGVEWYITKMSTTKK